MPLSHTPQPAPSDSCRSSPSPSPAPSSQHDVGLASDTHSEPPHKRKNMQHSPQPSPPVSDAAELAPQAEEAVAFRLFSHQKAPTKVVLREADSPPPFVLDRRIRDVDDEAPAVVWERRQAIEAVCISGKDLLSLSHLPSPSARPSVPRTVRVPRPPTTSHPFPFLAFLNAVLPSPLRTLAPSDPPQLEGDPPGTPHEGLLARAPFTAVAVREGKEGKKSGKDPRPRQPPRNPVLRFAADEGAPLRLRMKAVLEVEKAGAKAALRQGKGKGAGKATKGGQRLSKARRARVRRREGGQEKAVASQASTA